MNKLFFALQHSADHNDLVPVTFDERPIPGKRNAEHVNARSIREVPEQYRKMSLDDLYNLLLSGAIG